MSVALLAQGETVPRRGITTTSVPAAVPGAARRWSSRAASLSRVPPSSGASLQAQCTCCALTATMRAQAAVRRASSAWARNADKALPPSKCSKCLGEADIGAWAGLKAGRAGDFTGRVG